MNLSELAKKINDYAKVYGDKKVKDICCEEDNICVNIKKPESLFIHYDLNNEATITFVDKKTLEKIQNSLDEF